MSGQYRKSLGLINHRLDNYIESLNLERYIILPNLELTYESNKENFEELIRDLEHELSKLMATKSSLNEKLEQWSSYITGLGKNDKEMEEKIYEERTTVYYENIERTEVLILEIRKKLKELRAKFSAFIKEQTQKSKSDRSSNSMKSIEGVEKKVNSKDLKKKESVLDTDEEEDNTIRLVKNNSKKSKISAFKVPDLYIRSLMGI